MSLFYGNDLEKESNNNNNGLFRHTTHESQADTTLFLGHWLNLFMRKLRPITALKINNSIILRFLNEYVGSSPSSIDDCTRYLLEQKDNIARGLTKPWS